MSIGDQWAAVRQVWAEAHRPSPVEYLRCDGCGQVTAHLMVNTSYTRITLPAGDVERLEMPQARCDGCAHTQVRAVGDQVAPDAEVSCTGRRSGWQLWRRCRRVLAVPAAAALVTCPWCAHHQPGPAGAGG